MPKKVTNKTTNKKVVKQETCCGSNCHCGCNCQHGGHIIKYIIVLCIVFCIGVILGSTMFSKNVKHHKPCNQSVVFTDGCLVMDSISCPKLRENIVIADINKDNCISAEEYQNFIPKKHMKGPRR